MVTWLQGQGMLAREPLLHEAYHSNEMQGQVVACAQDEARALTSGKRQCGTTYSSPRRIPARYRPTTLSDELALPGYCMLRTQAYSMRGLYLPGLLLTQHADPKHAVRSRVLLLAKSNTV